MNEALRLLLSRFPKFEQSILELLEADENFALLVREYGRVAAEEEQAGPSSGVGARSKSENSGRLLEALERDILASIESSSRLL